MSRFRLTPEAIRDLREISNYISSENRDAAARTRKKLRQQIVEIARSPGIGHRREDLVEEDVYFYPVQSWLIMYVKSTKPLQVIRILHGSRDIQAIFEKE